MNAKDCWLADQTSGTTRPPHASCTGHHHWLCQWPSSIRWWLYPTLWLRCGHATLPPYKRTPSAMGCLDTPWSTPPPPPPIQTPACVFMLTARFHFVPVFIPDMRVCILALCYLSTLALLTVQWNPWMNPLPWWARPVTLITLLWTAAKKNWWQSV